MKYVLAITDESGSHQIKFDTLFEMMKIRRFMEELGCICSWSMDK